ncbi:MAG: AMP-binding protein [Bacteroidia bacterium]|nr:AMP-binding protein [Bacteroidia bacterium]
MPFSINYKGRNYSLESFLSEEPDAPFLCHTHSFLKSWKEDSEFVFYSSGTTAAPKRLVFKKWQLIASAEATIAALNLRSDEHILLCLDSKFVGGAMMLARALVLDCSITLAEPSSNILDILDENHGYTFASFVPLQLNNLEQHLVKFERISKVLVGGTSVSSELKKLLGSARNRVYHSYGATETLSHVALLEFGKDSFYKAIKPYKIRCNEEGQICIQSPILKDEWLTNDLGKFYDETSFEIFGRLDFLINSGAYKVQPEYIEKCIQNAGILPTSFEFVLAKAPHPLLMEEVVLVCTQANGSDYLEQIGKCLQEMGLSYAKPRRIILFSELPKNENGKIMRARINEVIENEEL